MINIDYGGNLLDVDSSTKAGFDYKSRLLENSGGVGRSIDLSVPATRRNCEIFAFHELEAADGVRQSVDSSLVGDGVCLAGRVYVVSHDGGRFNLMFVYGKTLGMFYTVNNHVFNDTLTVSSKTTLPRGGVVPNFGFYGYRNWLCDGDMVGTPTSLFPSANLGYVIDTLAAFEGYTVVYPDAALGRMYDAHAYGMVLPKMTSYTQFGIDVQGSARNGFTATVQGGGTLASAGLSLVTRRYKRGFWNENVTAWTFEAAAAMTVVFDDSNRAIVASGQGYDIMNAWNGGGCMFELAAGEWFTVVNFSDWSYMFGQEKWNGSAASPHGYESDVNTSFSVNLADGYAVEGTVLDLSMCLPDMTLKQYLDAYCDLICAAWETDAAAKEIRILPRDWMLGNLALWANLDHVKVVKVGKLRRFIEGWAQSNVVRCASADYVPEPLRFSRSYVVNNDYLEKEREVAVIPFNDGEWGYGPNGEKLAYFDDVVLDNNGEVQYKGCLSLYFENSDANSRTALHLQTVNDIGLGVPFSEFTRYAVSLEVSVVIPLYSFFELNDRASVAWRGREWAVESATWSEGVCLLNLLSVNV